MSSYPTGTVTFLFTDIEDSAKLAHQYGDRWEIVRSRHHEILHKAIDAHNGYVFQIVGDAFCAVFHTAIDGVNAAIECQCKIQDEEWECEPIKIRVGVHTGTARFEKVDDRSGGYTGYFALVLVQRVMSIGYGDQILLSNASAELVRGELPGKVTLQDMGRHRLKGLPTAEQIWQLNVPGLPHEFPRLQSLNIRSGNLPIQPTSFVGREKEIDEVRDALLHHPLVTLIGPGGTGKTRLSLQVGQYLLDQFSDGVWFVELADILDPVLVPRTMAITIGLRDEPQRPVIDMLCDYLEGRQMLVILDNCEHLVEACALLSDRILRSAPNVRILASSREVLGVPGESIYRVPSLGLPDTDTLFVEALTEHESTRLFVERATSADSNFSATNDNASSIAQVCIRLDGIPLAIELAAAKVRFLSVSQIAKRLNDRFRLLTGGSRTAMERHQTLRATIDWSYNLLQPSEKICFRRLSVFVDGWTLEAAEAVLVGGATTSVARSDVLPMLEQLINKSLIIKEEIGSDSRYRMLETIKQYADERLIESNENDEIRDQHLEYFLSLAATAAPHLLCAEQLEWLSQLDTEYPNIRAAFDRALRKESPMVSLRLCDALGPFWSIRGYWLEGSKWLSRTFASCTRIESDLEKVAYVKARYWDANFAYARDDLDRAGLSAEMSLTLAQECADKRDIAIARYMVSLIHYQKENNKIARPLVEQSLKDFQELQEAYWEALCWDTLGRILTSLGELKPSQRILRKLETARIAGERNQLADALFIFSIWHYTYNRIEDAIRCAEEADLLWKQIGMQINSASMTFALIAWSNGDYERSISYYKDLCDFFGWQGEKHMRSETISCLGNLAMEQGDLGKAQMCLEQALTICREIDYKSAVAVRLVELGTIYYLQGDMAKFKEMVIESISQKNVLSEYNKARLLIDLLEAKAMQTHKIYISMLGALWAYETKNERPLRIMHKSFLTDQAISVARNSLGVVDFEAIFTEGTNMSLDTALDLALKAIHELDNG